MALDLGTTSVRAIIFDQQAKVKGLAQKAITMSYPQPGWVEQDPEEIFILVKKVMRSALRQAKLKGLQIAAIGITNQRETTIVWDVKKGSPIAPAIVWQDRRTVDYCQRLKKEGFEKVIRKKTGLVIDSYFSATKLRWLLRQATGHASQADLRFGTMDSWIIWKLTGGQVHATDVSNASRTLLYNIVDLKWDEELLKKFGVSGSMLPEVRSSAGDFGLTERSILHHSIPITAVCGDQQSALFGQCCFDRGQMKNTYGTGAFLLLNIGSRPVITKEPLLTTVAWKIDGEVTYALEGGVFACGTIINWFKDELGIVQKPAETGVLAESLDSNEGVYFVPAFSGLGAPYWDSQVRGTLLGLTQGSGKAQLVRAGLEAIAHQTTDVIQSMKQGSRLDPKQIRVDGGVSRSDFVMQYQADLARVALVRPKITETTALGVAMMAGLNVGYWSSKAVLKQLNPIEQRWKPEMNLSQQRAQRKLWQAAVKSAQTWKK